MMINQVMITGVLNTDPYLFNNDLNGTLTYVLELILDNNTKAFVKANTDVVKDISAGTTITVIGELGADILADKQAVVGTNILMKHVFIHPAALPHMNEVLLTGSFEGVTLYGAYNQEAFKTIRLKTTLNGHIKVIDVVLTQDLERKTFQIGDTLMIKGQINTYLNALLSLDTNERYFIKAPSIIASEID